jgi:hypothetical protein
MIAGPKYSARTIRAHKRTSGRAAGSTDSRTPARRREGGRTGGWTKGLSVGGLKRRQASEDAGECWVAAAGGRTDSEGRVHAGQADTGG